MSDYGPPVWTGNIVPEPPRGSLESDVTRLAVASLSCVRWRLRFKIVWLLLRGRILDLDIRDLGSMMTATGKRYRIAAEVSCQNPR